MKPSPALTLKDLQAMKRSGEKISCLTAYDASFSAVIDQAGIDIMLVGDSLGMTVQGHSSTLPVSIGDMVYHSQCVSRARSRSFVMTDLPFMSYAKPLQAAKNAAKLMQSGGTQMVKLEGANVETIHFLVTQGIPVCGHLGLLPQHINQLGSYSVQGKEPAQAEQILADALAIEQAGAQLLVLECIPAQLAKTISQQLTIPTIGIGAGIDCDGQVLVLHDMLGITPHTARFSKNFLADAPSISAAIGNYHQAVKQAQFPAPEHSY